MAFHALETKLFTPANRPDLVPRPRLLEQVQRGLKRKLTLVSAPAGFGKTSLLVDSLHQLDLNASWIALDARDNHPGRFLQYFILALQKISPGAGEPTLLALQSDRQVDIEGLLPALLNEIAAIPLPFGIVLDDYHVIRHEQIHSSLHFLLDHQPPHMHLIVSTRADPPWPLARLRARGEMEEVRAEDLRFLEDETAHLLNDQLGLALSSDEIRAISQRTDGWIAGLQMAALSLRDKQDRSQYIRAFSGSHRFVLDFLMEEVLEQIPEDLRDFLFRTSVLKQLNGPLCDFILHRENSQAVLHELENKNLFLIPLDDHRTWYRYHPLFADMLKSRFALQEPALANQLHLRASLWFEEQGDIDSAIEQALAGRDFESTAAIIERHVAAVKDSLELSGLSEWLQELPEKLVRQRPWLCIGQAWALAYEGSAGQAHDLLNQAEQAFGETADDHGRGHIASIRCYLHLFDNQIPQSIEQGRKALLLLPKRDLSTRISAATSLASALRVQGDLDSAYNILKEAVVLSKRLHRSQTTVRLLCGIAALQITLGELDAAEQTLQEAVQTGQWVDTQGRSRTLPAAGLACTRLAYIHALMNRLETASEEIQKAIELSSQWGQANALWEAYRTLAFIHYCQGDPDGTRSAGLEAAKVAAGMTGERVHKINGAEESRYRIKEGEIGAAQRWASEYGLQFDQAVEFVDLEFYEVYADILFAQEKYPEAQTLLQKMVEVAQETQAVLFQLSSLVQLSMVYQRQQQDRAALETVRQALDLAESSGIVHGLIDQGPPMRDLLRRVIARRGGDDFVQSIVDAIDERFPVERTHERSRNATWFEPLTRREIDVLRRLESDLPVPELAREMNISVSTLRTHMRNIYAKLGVHSRFEATTRGRALGLIGGSTRF